MKVPFHTNCREHWGCHPSCPVAALVRHVQELEQTIANLERELQKKENRRPLKNG